MVSVDVKHHLYLFKITFIVQELCESQGGRPELSVLTSLLVSVDVKQHLPCLGTGHSLSLIRQPTSEDIKQHNSSSIQASKPVWPSGKALGW